VGEGGELTEPEGDLELADVDWGDAMKEVDDLLDETDDEESTSLFGGNATDDGDSDTGSVTSIPSSRPRKRPRVSTAPTTLAIEGIEAGVGKTESPLQKRIKTSQSRKSGLKTSVSAATLATSAVTPEREDVTDGGGIPRTPFESSFPASSQASQASSSDDDDLLAALAEEVEGGF
jgi:hypothetical protein